MPDRRPRNQRPRSRGGRNRLAQRAAVHRQHDHIAALRSVLEPDAQALAESVDPTEVVERIRAQATALASERHGGDVTDLVEATLDEIFGLGPLEPVLRDADVRQVRIEGAALFAGAAPVRGFRDAAHARRVVDRILAAVGQRLDQGPVQATMMDGSTVQARLDGDLLRVRIQRP